MAVVFVRAWPLAILFFLFCLSTASAAYELQNGTVLNTSASNSSMTFQARNLTCDLVENYLSAIYLFNCSYVESGSSFNITPRTINWSSVNDAIDSGEFGLPVISVSSPPNGLHTQDPNVLFNISVSGITRVSTRFYSLDHGSTNITFSGSAVVNSPAGSYHPFFCVNGSIGNLNCTTELDYTVLGPDQTSGDAGGGGGGAAGSAEGSQKPIRLAGIKVSTDDTWFFGIDNAVKAVPLDLNGSRFSGALISIQVLSAANYSNDSLMVSTDGEFEQHFIVDEAVNGTIVLNITAVDQTKVVSQQVSIRLSEPTPTDKALEGLKQSLGDGLIRLFRFGEQYFLELLLSFLGVMVLFALIYKTSKAKP